MGLRWPFFKAILGKEERGFDVHFHCFKSSSGTEGRILPALVSLDPSFPHFSTSTPRTPGHHELSASSPVHTGVLLHHHAISMCWLLWETWADFCCCCCSLYICIILYPKQSLWFCKSIIKNSVNWQIWGYDLQLVYRFLSLEASASSITQLSYFTGPELIFASAYSLLLF